MRVTFVNKHTGTLMYVDESRVAEYEAMGHSIASVVIAEVKAEEVPAVAEKKSVRRKKSVKGE